MKIVKSIDEKCLAEAMRKCNETSKIYKRVKESNEEASTRIRLNSIDARDLEDLAFFLRYKNVINHTGEALSEAEFEDLCYDLIDAFANDDKERIFAYLDQWVEFGMNFNPSENITTEAEAIAAYVYTRSQQGLSVTKMKEYPDYVMSRFPDTESLLKLQQLQSEMFMQTGNCDMLYTIAGLSSDPSAVIEYDKNNGKISDMRKVVKTMMEEQKPDRDRKNALALNFLDAFKFKEKMPETKVVVGKVDLPQWVKDAKTLDPKSKEYKENADSLHDVVIMTSGGEQTGRGLIRKYLGEKEHDTGFYKLIFLDDKCILDLIDEPVTKEKASEKLMEALAKKTNVVSMVQLTEINGKFEYKVNVLDVSDRDTSPEYTEKLNAIKNDPELQKSLYQDVDLKLRGPLTMGRELKKQAKIQAVKKDSQDILDGNKVLRRENIKATKKNFGFVGQKIDETRRIYNLRSNYIIKNTEEGKDFKALGLDERDFQDIMVITRYAKTLGVGNKDLTVDEYRMESEYLVKAFGTQNHALMKPYLDRMYAFIANYEMPKKIETADEVFKALMYIRLQQTSTVKLQENPWYLKELCPTLIEKARFKAMEAEYLEKYNDIMEAIQKGTGYSIGKGVPTFAEIFGGANPAKKIELDAFEKQEQEREEKEHAIAEEYRLFSKRYNEERRLKLESTDEFEQCFNFKLELPDNLYANLLGDNVSEEALRDAAYNFRLGILSNIYNDDYEDSHILRSYGFNNIYCDDVANLIFIDGKSLYDIAVEKNGSYNLLKASEILIKTLVDKSGLVQFARILKDDELGDIKVELDTIEVNSSKIESEEYYRKLAAFETNPKERFDSIKKKVNDVCKARKTEIENAQSEAEAKEFFNNIDDVFETRNTEVKPHDGLEKVFALNRFNAVNNFLSDIESFTGAKIDNNKLIGKIEEAFNAENFTVEKYNDIWKEVWMQAMQGLKNKSYDVDFEKTIPFSYVTGMVERCMKGALKLYGHSEDDVKPFGGNTSKILADGLKIDCPTWENKHYDKYLLREESDIPFINKDLTIDEQIERWENMPEEAFINMQGYETDNKDYRDEQGNLTENGKKWAVGELAKLYDVVNAISKDLNNDIYNENDPNSSFDMELENDREHIEMRQEKLKSFAKAIKDVALQMGVMSEKEFDAISGDSNPIYPEIEKFKDNMDKLFKIEENLVDEKKAQYAKDEEKQWNDLLNADLDLFEDEDEEEIEEPKKKLTEEEIELKKQIADKNKALRRGREKEQAAIEKAANQQSRIEKAKREATKVDVATFKNGKYNISSRNPNSAIALAKMGQLSTLGVFFGGLNANEQEKVIKLDDQDISLYYEDLEQDSADLAANYFTYINPDDLHSMMDRFVLDSSVNGKDKVDKVLFEREYKMLFTDLYTTTLQNINKKCCLEGKTMSIYQMTKSMKLIDSMMQIASKEVGYPEEIKNGGLSAKEIKDLRNNFAEQFIPHNSEEVALRKMQAQTVLYDFDDNNWKSGLGYTAFNQIINNQANAVRDNDLNTPEAKKEAAQAYRAMVMYSRSRSGWSKFVNYFGKYRQEKNAIEAYKNAVMTKADLTEREFNDLLAVSENESLGELKTGIEDKFKEEKNKKVEKEDSLLNNPLVERISVSEADHNRESSISNPEDLDNSREDLNRSSSLGDEGSFLE